MEIKFKNVLIRHVNYPDCEACDNCKKRLCVLADNDWTIVGCAYQDSNGIKHFCNRACLKCWLDYEEKYGEKK